MLTDQLFTKWEDFEQPKSIASADDRLKVIQMLGLAFDRI